MITRKSNILHTTILLGLGTLAVVKTENQMQRLSEAQSIASDVLEYFYGLFHSCLDTTMPYQQKFLFDDLQSFVNLPSKTTVGIAPKFTSNRKFFANLISTTAFKEMLAKDEEELRRNFVKKIKFCDTAIMDQDLLKDLYDREVDQSKL